MTADGGPAIIVGAPHAENGHIFNAVFVLDDGQIIARRDKVNLPNYGVFDDKRNFTAGGLPGPVMLRVSNLAYRFAKISGSLTWLNVQDRG